MKVAKPFGYYGGKEALLHEILPYIPPHSVYCEPFAGGASVFWAKPLADLNILNDAHLALFKFYKVASTQPDELIRALECTLYHHEEHRRACEIYRNPEAYADLEVAVALFVAVRMSFAKSPGNGFGRSFGNEGAPIYEGYNKTISELPASLAKLRNAQCDNMDAVELIKRINKKSDDAFMFVDPPYYNARMGHYGGYTEEDFVRLLDVLAESPHRWMLTCYHNANYEGRGWEVRYVESYNRTGNRQKTEAIITNYKQIQQLTLC